MKSFCPIFIKLTILLKLETIRIRVKIVNFLNDYFKELSPNTLANNFFYFVLQGTDLTILLLFSILSSKYQDWLFSWKKEFLCYIGCDTGLDPFLCSFWIKDTSLEGIHEVRKPLT